MKSKNNLWNIHILIPTVIEHGFIFKSSKLINHALQFKLEDGLLVNWYTKAGRTTVQGTDSREKERLYSLIYDEHRKDKPT